MHKGCATRPRCSVLMYYRSTRCIHNKHTHIHVHTYTKTNSCIHVRPYACICINTNARVSAHMSLHMCARSCTPTCMHKRIIVHTRWHTHTQTHTHSFRHRDIFFFFFFFNNCSGSFLKRHTFPWLSLHIILNINIFYVISANLHLKTILRDF